MSAPFRTSRRVEFADTDMAGIAHFANFFRYMEAAEVDYLQALGLSVDVQWEGERLGFPRVAASCDYLRPVTFPEVLQIEVRVDRVGRKSLSYAFDFFSGGEPVARGRVVSVCCRVIGPERRLEAIPIPDALRARLTQGRPPEPGPDEGL
jgi:YbgC/YbaW family acyl-CoA thioester hydrolase